MTLRVLILSLIAITTACGAANGPSNPRTPVVAVIADDIDSRGQQAIQNHLGGRFFVISEAKFFDTADRLDANLHKRSGIAKVAKRLKLDAVIELDHQSKRKLRILVRSGKTGEKLTTKTLKLSRRGKLTSKSAKRFKKQTKRVRTSLRPTIRERKAQRRARAKRKRQRQARRRAKAKKQRERKRKLAKMRAKKKRRAQKRARQRAQARKRARRDRKRRAQKRRDRNRSRRTLSSWDEDDDSEIDADDDKLDADDDKLDADDSDDKSPPEIAPMEVDRSGQAYDDENPL